jgi:hypothetical protein
MQVRLRGKGKSAWLLRAGDVGHREQKGWGKEGLVICREPRGGVAAEERGWGQGNSGGMRCRECSERDYLVHNGEAVGNTDARVDAQSQSSIVQHSQ